MARSITVSGMTCEGCKENVEDAHKTIDGVTQVHTDHETETVDIVAEDEVENRKLHAAIENAGYDVTSLWRKTIPEYPSRSR